MEETTQDNVINMRSKTPIFSQELKTRLVLTLGNDEKAKQTIDNVENVICSHLILKLREAGEKLGHYLGERFSQILGL